MKYALSVALAATLSFTSFAQKSPSYDQLTREGIELYDNGDFEAALEKYNEALELSEDNPSILYERVLTYFKLGDDREAVRDLKDILDQDLSETPAFASQVVQTYANYLDDEGKSNEAVRLYEDALDEYGEQRLLRYNMAISLARAEEYNRAEEELLGAAAFEPTHASASYTLGLLINGRNGSLSRVNISLLWFLTLEPSGPRANVAMQNFIGRWEQTVTKEDDNTFQITLNPSEDDHDAAFSTCDMLTAMTGSLVLSKELDSLVVGPANNFPDDISEEFRNFIGYVHQSLNSLKMIDAEETNSEFYEFVIPIFVELSESEHFTTYCYYISSSRFEESSAWLEDHPKEMENMAQWFGDKFKTY